MGGMSPRLSRELREVMLVCGERERERDIMVGGGGGMHREARV